MMKEHLSPSTPFRMMKILNNFPDSHLTIIMSAKSVAISFSSVLEEVDHCFPFQSRTPIRILLNRDENSKFELQEAAFPSLVDSTFRPPCGKNKNTLHSGTTVWCGAAYSSLQLLHLILTFFIPLMHWMRSKCLS